MPCFIKLALLLFETIAQLQLAAGFNVGITPPTPVIRSSGSSLMLTCTLSFSATESTGRLQLTRSGARTEARTERWFPPLKHQSDDFFADVNSEKSSSRKKRQSDNAVSIAWYKLSANGRERIGSTTGERVFVELDATMRKLKLIFSSLRDVDTASYVCSASRSRQNSESTVAVMVTQPTQISRCEENQYITLDATSTIVCEANGIPEPSRTWFFRRSESDAFEVLGRLTGQPLRTISNTATILPQGLNFDRVSLDNGGFYEVRFEIESLGDIKIRRINVGVAVAPTIDRTRVDEDALQGSSAELQCDASGTPAPKFSWYRRDDPNTILDSVASPRFEANAATGRLRINQLVPTDTGEYICFASNSAGNATASLAMEVKTIPEIIRLPTYQTSMANKSVTIKCVAAGSAPLDVRVYKISEDGSTIDMSQPHAIDARINVQTSLPTLHDEPDCDVRVRYCKQQVVTIVLSSPSDTANYTCIAKNDAGSVNRTSILEIYYGPTINKDVTKVFGYDEVPANLTCIAYGKPVPEFFWQKISRMGATSVNIANVTFVSEYGLEQQIQLFGDTRNYRVIMQYHPRYTVSTLEIKVNSMRDDRNLFGSYRCSVFGRGVSGNTADSHTIEFLMAGPPKAPISCSIALSTGSYVRLAVEPSSDTGGFPLTGYAVNFRTTNSDGSLSPVSSDPALFKMGELIELRGLRPRTEYRFQVAARNRIGVGAQTECAHETPDFGPPAPPEIIPARASATSRTFELAWMQDNDGGLPISQYVIRVRQISNKSASTDDIVKVSPAGSTTAMVDSLQPATSYELELSAINTEGASAPSTFRFQTLPEPKVVVSQVVEATNVLPKWITIGIIAACAVITLAVIDITCYFWKACGFTHTFCIMCCNQDKRQVKTQYNFEAAERRYLMTLERSRENSRSPTPLGGVSPSVERKDTSFFQQNSGVNNTGTSKSNDFLSVGRRGEHDNLAVAPLDTRNNNNNNNNNNGFAAAQIHAAPPHNFGNGSANNHGYYP